MMGNIQTGDLVSAARINSWELLGVAEVTSGTAASLTLTVPAGITSARIVGRGRTNLASNLRDTLNIKVNNHTATNTYVSLRRTLVGDGTTASTLATSDNVWVITNILAGATAGSTVMGSFEMMFPDISATSHNRLMHFAGGVIPSTSSAEARHVHGSGHVGLTSAITSVTLSAGGSFVVGTRYELLRA
jgi:hypothetical protein